MMADLTFYILDVFAEEKYAGNQLAVFRNAGNLSDELMQKIALEMNFAETTFILSDDEHNGGFDVRIFTPQDEVPFAGHPTLGTSYIIQQEIIKSPVEKLNLNLKVGQIPVTLKYIGDKPDILWMKQIEPSFGTIVDPGLVAESLCLDIDDLDVRYPSQCVSTGLDFMIVPLKNLEIVKKARINVEKYFDLLKGIEALAIFIFSPETYFKENDLNARMFADQLGVPEDAATGSANGCLAGYLVKYRYFDSDQIDIQVEQGYEMGRPSQLYLKADNKNNTININVGGKVHLIAKGEFLNAI
jgi:trans-2,3-dihydro-3-hydroxyanthranilate isomerase